MSHTFDNKAVVGSWEEASEILDGEANIVALEDNGVIKEGDFTFVEENPHIYGVYLDRDIVSTDEVPRPERANGGFYTRNSEGERVEIKYRFPEELREYPEPIHVHNVPELYVPFKGEFDMMVSEEGLPMDFTQVTIDEPFVVPSGMYHGIRERYGDAGLVIVRGDPEGYEDTVGKWDITGEQVYDHAGHLDFPAPTEYKEEVEYTL